MIHLREIRSAKHISQYELARMLGITRSAISMYEIDKRSPDIPTLIKISQVLDCTLDELILGKSNG